jgi:uncharacterized protein (TIGR03067 family)
MSPRTKAGLAIGLALGPLILGTLIAAWIVGPPFRNTTRVKAVEVEKESEDDRQRLQGSWEAVRVERNGKVLYRGLIASQAKVSFVRDTVIFADRGARLEGVFRVDQNASPKTFDLVVTIGGVPVNYPVGIYHLSGDIFRLCFAFPAPERPTTFETSPGSGRTLFIYRRTQTSDQEPDDRGQRRVMALRLPH